MAASAAIGWPAASAQSPAGAARLQIEPAEGPHLPLHRTTVHISGTDWQTGTLVVLDGAGREYVRETPTAEVAFTIGGALGRHSVRLRRAWQHFEASCAAAGSELAEGQHFQNEIYAVR